MEDGGCFKFSAYHDPALDGVAQAEADAEATRQRAGSSGAIGGKRNKKKKDLARGLLLGCSHRSPGSGHQHPPSRRQFLV
jgi:hypothetical protein